MSLRGVLLEGRTTKQSPRGRKYHEGDEIASSASGGLAMTREYLRPYDLPPRSLRLLNKRIKCGILLNKKKANY